MVVLFCPIAFDFCVFNKIYIWVCLYGYDYFISINYSILTLISFNISCFCHVWFLSHKSQNLVCMDGYDSFFNIFIFMLTQIASCPQVTVNLLEFFFLNCFQYWGKRLLILPVELPFYIGINIWKLCDGKNCFFKIK